MTSKEKGTHQLCTHTVSSLERPLIQEVIIAPVASFLVLLVCMVYIQQCQVVTCVTLKLSEVPSSQT
jgi:hypothetical protein